MNAPPRRMRAPSRLTVCAVSISCSRDSTAHGPAMTTSSWPRPISGLDPDPGPFLLVLRACELVWRADADDLVDAGQGAQVADPLPTMPTTPMTVRSSPTLRNASRPCSSTVRLTSSTSSCVAVGRITTIIESCRAFRSLSGWPPEKQKDAGAFASCVCGHECLRRRVLLACLVPASRKTTAVTSVRGA